MADDVTAHPTQNSRQRAPDQSRDARPDSPTPLLANKAFLLSRLGGEARRRFAQVLTTWELNPTHHNVMSLLGSVGEASQQYLVQTLGIDRANMVDLIDLLEKRGLAERTLDPKDRRRYAVKLTSSGATLLGQIRQAAEKLNQELFAGLDAHEQVILHKLLVKLFKTLN